MWAMCPNIQTTDEKTEEILRLTSAFWGHLIRDGMEVVVNEVMVSEGHL